MQCRCSAELVDYLLEEGPEAAQEIQAASPTGLACDFVQCDVRSFASIKAACAKFTS